MKKYLCVSRFSIRNQRGEPTGDYVNPGQTVELSDKDAERLLSARCVKLMPEISAYTFVETATVQPPEVRRRGRKKR